MQAHVLVCFLSYVLWKTLGASSYTYAEAARNQQLDSWIQVNMHALEFYGGVPRLSVPDNTKTGVTKACRYDHDLNPTYQEFAMHYGMGVLPPGHISLVIRPRWSQVCSWSSGGSWLHFGGTGSTASMKPTRPSGRFWSG